jgi:hypothetical protein
VGLKVDHSFKLMVFYHTIIIVLFFIINIGKSGAKGPLRKVASDLYHGTIRFVTVKGVCEHRVLGPSTQLENWFGWIVGTCTRMISYISWYRVGQVMSSVPILNTYNLGDLNGNQPDVEGSWRSEPREPKDYIQHLQHRTNAFNRRLPISTNVRSAVRTVRNSIGRVATGVSGGSLVIPGAALIAGGAAVAGYGIYHYPGHQYLGPGTDLATAKKPIDVDDSIARSHDIAYKKAVSNADIVTADSKAIGAFEDDYSQTGNLHSKVARGLLGAKQAVEHYIGPIYPQVMVRAFGPPPYTRPNWDCLNEGQRRYAMEQYNVARVFRGLPVDHPRPPSTSASSESEAGSHSEPASENSSSDSDDLAGIIRTLEEEGLEETFAEILATLNMPAPASADENQPNRGTKCIRSEVGESSAPARTGKGAVGGAAVDVSSTGSYVFPRSRITDEWHIIQFKKTHKLLSYGIAPTLFKH